MFQLEVDSEINLLFLKESFADNLFKLIEADREYLTKWSTWPLGIKNVEDSTLFIKNSFTALMNGKLLCYALEYRGEFVGTVSYSNIEKNRKTVNIAYWISSEYQGKGIVTRACGKMIQNAFETMGMEKVEICVATENKQSRRVCERLGLTLEKIVTDAENLHGTIVDHAVYGLHAESL